MSNLEQLKSYLESRISRLKKEQLELEAKEEQKRIIDNIIYCFNNNEFSDLDIDELYSALLLVYNEKEAKENLDIFKEVVKLYDYFDNDEEDQIKDAKKYLLLLSDKLDKFRKNIEIKTFRRKIEIRNELRIYEEYSSLIEDNKIVRPLEENQLVKFSEFLMTTSLDKEVAFDLVVEFMTYNIQYYEKLEHIKSKRTQNITEKNSKKLKEQFIPKKEVNPIFIDIALTSEEQKIYDRIKEIIEIIKKDKKELLSDPLVELLKDDFSLSLRKRIYNSSNDKFNLILLDLQDNLLLNFSENKDSIIDIFNYIISVFNKEYNQKIGVSKQFDFKDLEEVELNRLLELLEIAKSEMSVYNGLPESEKNIIKSIKNLIEDGQSDRISDVSSLYSEAYINCLVLFDKLITAMNMYISDKEGLLEIINDSSAADIDEYREYLEISVVELKVLLKKLNEEYGILLTERQKVLTNQVVEEDSIEKIDKSNNLIVFLPNSRTSSYYIVDDQETIMSKNRNSMKAVASCLKNVCLNPNFTEFLKVSNDVTIVPVSDIANYSSEVKPHRLRHGDARIAYTKLPVSEYNKAYLREVYNMSANPEVILIIACDCKMTSSTQIYKEFNSRIAKEIFEIRRIRNIFGSDFNDDTLKEAFRLLSDSGELYHAMEDNPQKPLLSGKEEIL